jgi:hypothetical protein
MRVLGLVFAAGLALGLTSVASASPASAPVLVDPSILDRVETDYMGWRGRRYGWRYRAYRPYRYGYYRPYRRYGYYRPYRYRRYGYYPAYGYGYYPYHYRPGLYLRIF